MSKKVLLLGRKGVVVEDAKKHLDDQDIDDVRSTFAKTDIDHVFMGAGIDLEKRLEIVKEVFNLSQTTTIHMKNEATGPQDFLPFVRAILLGLRESKV
jgi:hypothetical protein